MKMLWDSIAFRDAPKGPDSCRSDFIGSSLQAIEYVPIKKYLLEALKTDLNRRDAPIR
jgi:hypothetical protein